MPPPVTLAGVTLPADTSVVWEFRYGVDPYTTYVSVAAADVATFDALVGKATTLVIGTRTINDVWVLGVEPGPLPELRRVTLADRRWKWNRQHVRRDYNSRVRSGDRRLVAEGVSDDVREIAEKVVYRQASLKNGTTPWVGRDVLADVLELVDGKAAAKVWQAARTGPPIEDLHLDDPGDAAIARALEACPGASPWVDDAGNVLWADTLDQAGAAAALAAAAPPAVGWGLAGITRNQGIRPANVNVLFSIEQELRFDSLDEGGAYAPARTSRYLENVAPIPDASLTMADGRVLIRGTYVTFDELFRAWNLSTVARPGKRVQPLPISHDMVQRAWWNLEFLYTSLGQSVSSTTDDWAARIQCVRNHYRLTYRIAPYWQNRILSLRANRVGIFDPVTQSRSPALVFCDYTIDPTAHGAYSDAGLQHSLMVVDGYNTSLPLAKAAPATLSIVDKDLGIVRLNFGSDTYGLFATKYPCGIDHGPALDFRKEQTPPLALGTVYGTGVGGGGEGARLSANHKVGIVLTGVPFGPNNGDQLFRVKVAAGEVESLVPGASPASGPDWDLRCSVTAARFMWRDENEADIDKVFGRDVDTPEKQPTYPASKLEAAGLLVDGKAMKALARAAAAALYSTLVDRISGAHGYALAGSVDPVGNLVATRVEAHPNGALMLVLRFGGQTQRLDLFQLLDAGTRRTLFGLGPT